MMYRIAVLLPTLILSIASNDAIAFPPPPNDAVQVDPQVEAVDITLYRNMGWVREVRRQRLESGVAEVTFAGLPRIDTGMAEVRTIDGGTFRLLGLDYSENRMVSRDRLGTAIARVETETSHELLELSYVSLELMWNASYVATVPEGVTDARLVASARIYNRTGRTFEDATIRLVSGISSDYSGRDEGRAEIPVPFAPLARVGSATPPRPLLELQALDLEPATVRDGYSKLVEYMSAPTVPIRIEHAIAFSSSGQERPARQDVNAGIFVDFRNDKTSGLGDYLVSGSFCIMVERADGERTLMGTGSINDTAPGELVRVYVGTAREIVATRTLLSYDGDRRTNDNERTYRLVVWNRKAHDVIVTLHDSGIERIVRSSHPFTVDTGPEALCDMAVPAAASTEVVYTAKYR